MVESQIDALRESRQPAMIVGEEGCGKDLVARYLYMHSVLSNRPFVIIDCEAVNEKTWAFLMKGSDSPFWEGNQKFPIVKDTTPQTHAYITSRKLNFGGTSHETTDFL